MTESQRWVVKCQNTADGSGDVIVDLPPELVMQLGLGVGSELAIEKVDDVVVLKPVPTPGASLKP